MDLNIGISKEQREQVERAVKDIPNAVPIVLSRAINKVAKPVESALVKEAAESTGFTQKDIRRKNVRLTRASYRELQASIKIRGGGIPVIKMKARQTREGVKFKDGKSGWKVIPHAFIAEMASGHKGAFRRRTGSTRRELREKNGRRYRTELPIDELKVDGVVSRLTQAGAIVRAQQQASQKLPQEIATQINVIIDQHAKGAAASAFKAAAQAARGADGE